MRVITVLICVSELIMYYIMVIIISVKVLNAEYNKIRIVLSSFAFLLLSVIGFLCDNKTFPAVGFFFQFVEIFICRISLSGIKLKTIILIYVSLFLTGVLMTTFLSQIMTPDPEGESYIDLAVNTVTFAVCILLCFTKIRQNLIQIFLWTPALIKILSFAVLIFSTSVVVLIFYEPNYSGSKSWIYVVKLFLIVLVILFSIAMPVLVAYSMSNKNFKKLAENYEKQINAQAEHYIQLSQSNFELRRFRHDFKNMFIGLSRLISEGKNDEAIEMLNNYDKDLTPPSDLFDTGNGIVDALLSDKQQQADKINTRIVFDGAIPPDRIDPTDLCIIFGNTLDNALEACKCIDSDGKTISVKAVCQSGFIFIEITNPVIRKIEFKGSIPSTTKKDKGMHGFGLYSLRKIIQNYSGEINCGCTDNTFRISIEFSLPDKCPEE